MATVGPAFAEISHKRSISNATVQTPPSCPVSKHSKVVLPLPEEGCQLHMCLCQFFIAHDIDLTMHEGVLVENDYSPDIIPFVADADLASILKVTNGVALKFKKFSKEWYACYEAKMASAQAKN